MTVNLSGFLNEMKRKIMLQKQTRVATFVPSTIDEEKRTVEVVWTTGAPVTRYDWVNGQPVPYTEVLEVSDKAIDLTRLNNGAPFINMHESYSLDKVIGVVERAWIENGKGHAIVRIATGDEDVEKIWNKLKQGIIRNISVGYSVEKFVEDTDEDGTRILTAVKWTPFELSAVTVPADAGAGVRNQSTLSPCVIETRNCETSKKKENKRMVKNRKKSRIEDEDEDLREDEDLNDEDREDEELDDEEREAEEEDQEDREDEKDPDDKDSEASRKKRKKRFLSGKRGLSSIERERRIYEYCEIAGTSLKQARAFVKSNKTLVQIRKELTDGAAARSASRSVNPYQPPATAQIKSMKERAAELFNTNNRG